MKRFIEFNLRKSINMSHRCGHNGPYHDPETPVRNKAHWLFVLSHLVDETDDRGMLALAHETCDYLLSEAARPMQASFYCRTNPEKDFCNGLIGQAWAMEGLVSAAQYLGRDDALKVAREVFFLHPWLEKQAIWRRVGVDGSYLTPDRTFNHQLWFASIASLLGDAEATRRSRMFLNNVGQHVQLYSDGVIFHQSRLGALSSYSKRGLDAVARGVLSEAVSLRVRLALYRKSVGYHGFNLYAFAILKQQFPEHQFWSSAKFAKMLRVTCTQKFLKSLDESIYGWPYNPPGIELAFAGEVFDLGHDYCQTWINRQFERTYNSDTCELLTRNVPDPATSAARIYEAMRLAGDYSLPLVKP